MALIEANEDPRAPFVVRLAQDRGVHYAWVVLGLALVIVVIAAGVRATPGVLIRPLEEDFAWSRSQISLAIAVSLVFYGIASPVSGKVAERFGLRAMVLIFLSTSGVGVALSTFIGALWQLQLFWGFFVGFITVAMLPPVRSVGLHVPGSCSRNAIVSLHPLGCQRMYGIRTRSSREKSGRRIAVRIVNIIVVMIGNSRTALALRP